MILSFAMLALVAAATQGGLPASLAEGIANDLPSSLQLVGIELSSPIDAEPQTPVSVEWKTAPRPGSNSVRVTFELPEGPTRRWAFVRLAPAVPVLVYRRALPAGHVLTPADVGIIKKPRGQGLDLLPSSVIGRKLARAVQANEPVLERSVRLPTPIPGRSPVEVVAKVGLVQVRLDGVLVRSARPGARGKVRVNTSGRALQGRLVDAGTFVLDGPGEKSWPE